MLLRECLKALLHLGPVAGEAGEASGSTSKRRRAQPSDGRIRYYVQQLRAVELTADMRPGAADNNIGWRDMRARLIPAKGQLAAWSRKAPCRFHGLLVASEGPGMCSRLPDRNSSWYSFLK